MKVELKGIEIQMGEVVTKLTLEEAQELRKQLNELFGEKIKWIPSEPTIIERDTWPHWTYPYGNPPYITYSDSPKPNEYVTVYCSG